MGHFLDKPKTHHEVDEAKGNNLVSGLAAMQGWRVEMEDAHAMTAEVPGEPTFSFFGVFDGHGGKYISDSAARDLLQRILSTEEWKSGARDVETIKSALRSGFIKLDEELKASEEVVTRDDHSGSTAVTALVTPTHVFVANCGDSRSIMVSDGAAIEMSHDHKPYLEAETKRIEEAGGTVAMKRVNGDLAVSRALGDFVYKRSNNLPPEKQQVSCEPEVIVHERNEAKDQYLVLACDGVWDVVSNEQCAALVLEKAQEGCWRPQDLAGEIIDRCFDLQSKDNMSAIVVAFPKAPSNSLSAEKKREYDSLKAARETAKEREAAGGGAGAMAEEGGGSA